MRRSEYAAESELAQEHGPLRRPDDQGLVQAALTPDAPASVQRAAMLDLQRAAGNSSTAGLVEEEDASASVKEVIGGGGQPLDRDTRSFMESRLGADFSDVRVHTDSSATQSAQRMNAHAYTVGSDIVFGEGQYQPSSDSGRHTLAHELTHVVQQRSGPVSGTSIGGGVQVSDPSDSFEQAAEHSASTVMSGGASPAAGTAVQRESAEDDEQLQMLPVQRVEDDEELQMLSAQREEEDELQMLSAQREEEDELQMLSAQREEEDELQMLSAQRQQTEEDAEEQDLAPG